MEHNRNSARRSISAATPGAPAGGIFFPHGGANFPNLVQETRPFPERNRSLTSSIESTARRCFRAGARFRSPLILRHAELGSASSPPPPGRMTSWTPDQVRGDEEATNATPHAAG